MKEGDKKCRKEDDEMKGTVVDIRGTLILTTVLIFQFDRGGGGKFQNSYEKYLPVPNLTSEMLVDPDEESMIQLDPAVKCHIVSRIRLDPTAENIA